MLLIVLLALSEALIVDVYPAVVGCNGRNDGCWKLYEGAKMKKLFFLILNNGAFFLCQKRLCGVVCYAGLCFEFD